MSIIRLLFWISSCFRSFYFSHTGSIAGSDRVVDALFRACGVMRVRNVPEMWHLAEALSMQPLPRGPRLGILTNAGGPAILAADELVGLGGQMAEISNHTCERLSSVLPENWSKRNPMDILGDAMEDRYAAALEIAAQDENIDGLLVILTPQSMTQSTATAKRVVEAARRANIPILANWMGGPFVAEGQETLRQGGVPNAQFPDSMAKTFQHMWDCQLLRQHLDELASVPFTPGEHSSISAKSSVQRMIDDALARGQTTLTEFESKELMALYGIPVSETRLASSAEEAAKISAEMGFPVVLKLNSHVVLHKSDVGGVKLNLGDAEAVKRAFSEIEGKIVASDEFEGCSVQRMIQQSSGTMYECILGVTSDPQCGPMVAFGMGGTLVEAFKDVELAVPPLSRVEASELIQRTKISRVLRGVRGNQPSDVAALQSALVRLSDLAVQHPRIREVDLNPVLVFEQGVVAVDARVILWPQGTNESDIPTPALEPYPLSCIVTKTARDGGRLELRPATPADEPLVHRSFPGSSHLWGKLTRMCFADFNVEMSLLCHSVDDESGRWSLVGVGRIVWPRFGNLITEPELRLFVAEDFVGRGVDEALVESLLNLAGEKGFQSVRVSSRSPRFSSWLLEAWRGEVINEGVVRVRV